MALTHGGHDRELFEKLVNFLEENKAPSTPPSQLILEIGKFFLGKPYVDGTLDTGKSEHLVVNLREFDCFTFVENVIALARCVKSRRESFESFQRLLQKIRYRQARLQGYASRLHYFSDWVHDNQKKGIVRDVTAEIGGRPFRKVISFMATHPENYLPLRVAVNLRRMKSVERRISRRSLYYIPKKFVRTLEDQIGDGDVIAITTNTEGLDVQHVGLALRVKDRIHLLHASSAERKVVFSEQTLYRYLMQSRTCSGIMVARITGKGSRIPGYKGSKGRR
jgi:hypothetical protein